MFLFSKSIIPEDSKSARRVLKPASVKRRFKAIFKKLFFGAWIGLYAIFMDFCHRRATKFGASCNSHNEIYDIGVKILYFQCFVTTNMFLLSKSIIPEDSKISRRDLEHVYVKRRFKAILKKLIFWAWIGLYAIFMDFCPRRATKFGA